MKCIKLTVLLTLTSLNTAFTQVRNDDAQTAESSSLVSPQIQVIPIQDSKTERKYELYIELPEDFLGSLQP